jgi:phage baseplate assembly protein W
VAKDFLGRGWAFPLEPDGAGGLGTTADEARVQQSILIILGTARGERVMRPDFGSRLHELIFAQINSTTTSLVSRYVTEALVKWEPRAQILAVEVSDEEAHLGKLLITIDYRVRATNSRFNLVYPFYLREGNDAGAQA